MPANLSQKLVNIPELGIVAITRRRRCRSLKIKVDAKEVKVSIPFRANFDEGERFLLEKLSWVKETSLRLAKNIPAQLFFDESTILFSQTGSIKIARDKSAKCHCKKIEHEVYIVVPEAFEIKLANVQNEIKFLIINHLRNASKAYLPSRVAFLANKYGIKYTNVKINNASTRWGSCSYKNNINLNLRLLLLPDELSDYIILHELAHVLHKNHGPRFWNFLEKIAEDARFKAKELKKFKITGLL